MSWHFSRALVAEYSAATCSDGDASVRLSETPTHGMSWSQGKTTDTCRRSRSGMTYAPSTDDHGEALLTWFLAASRARTSAQPEEERESLENGQDSGERWQELSVKYDRDSSSWKTHRCLWDEALPWCSVTLPRWGSMRDGVCWEQLTPERRIDESESGLWPTPTVRGNYNRKGLSSRSGDGLATAVKMWPTPLTTGLDGGSNSRKAAKARGMWPTPTARDWKSGKASQKTMERNSRPLIEQVGGSLNPNWVEWLMGWPIGWTDCEPLETDRFQQWCDSHGMS